MNPKSMKTFVCYALFTLSVWAAVYAQTLFHLITVWSESETYKHCFFILPISLYLINEKRVLLRSAAYKPSLVMLLPLLVVQFLYVVAEQLSIQLIAHFCAVSSLVIIIWASVGHNVFRIIAFPVFYLYLCVPFGEEFVPYLQVVTADISCSLLNVVGIPVYREGLYLYLPNGTFHVAEACAGVRFLIGTFALGVLLAYLNYQYLWKRVCFAFVCAVVPIIANGVRAFGIMVIGYSTDMQHAVGADHLVYGWFFFLFVLIILFMLGSIGTDKLPSYEGNTSRQSVKIRYSVFCVSCCILATPFFADKWFIHQDAYFVTDIKGSLREQYGKVENYSRDWMQTDDAFIQPTWTGRLNEVPVRITYREDSETQELVSSLHKAFNDDIYSLLSEEKIVTQGINSYRQIIIQNVYNETITLLIWYQLENQTFALPLEAKWRQLLLRMSGQRADGLYIVAEVEKDKTITQVIKELGLIALPPTIRDAK